MRTVPIGLTVIVAVLAAICLGMVIFMFKVQHNANMGSRHVINEMYGEPGGSPYSTLLSGSVF